jgi:hypothetical protein
MESLIHKLKAQSLKAHLAASRHVCSSLAREFETQSLTRDQKAAIAKRWEKALQETHGLQLAIGQLERRDSESIIDAATRVAEQYIPLQSLRP